MQRILIFLWIICPAILTGQTIKGKIYGNEKEGLQPLTGVNIYWEGTQKGVISDDKGLFEIKPEKGHNVLVFSFVGYETQKIYVNNRENLEITLEPNLQLEEVKVVQKNRGSFLSKMESMQVEKITSAELCKAPCCSLAESFETNPSVDVSYSDAVTGAKQIRLLGLDGIYSLLQLENLPDLRGLATNFGLSYVPGPWMESIQVSKGAASVVNGYDAIAGQINAEYKKPDSPEKLYLGLFTNAEGRAEFNGNGNIRFNGGRLTTSVMAHASGTYSKNDHNNDGFLDEPLSFQRQFSNRWKYSNHKGFIVQTGINLLNEDKTGGQVDFQKNMARTVQNPYGITIANNRYSGYFKAGDVYHDGHTGIAVLSNFSKHKNNSVYGIEPYEGDEARLYASAVLSQDLDKNGFHRINAGISYVYDDLSEKLYGKSFASIEKVPGIFSEYTLKPSENFTLMTGLRVDFHNIFGTFVTPRMHFRYKAGNHLTFRGNAGKGYRTSNTISDNISLLANHRKLLWDNSIMQEKAWNYGFAIVQDYLVAGRSLQINAELFHTNFDSQLVVDRETSVNNILLTALNGKSYATSFQVDMRWQPIERLDVLLAYRRNDVNQTIGGILREKPLVSRYKGLISMNYATNFKKWMFDYTAQFNGPGRLPVNPVTGTMTGQTGTDFPAYIVMNAQVSRFFRFGSIYLGCENLTDFMQMNPVSGAENPYNEGFDATTIWGPVMGRRIYVGLRYNINYE